MHRKAILIWVAAVFFGLIACSLFTSTATPPAPAQPSQVAPTSASVGTADFFKGVTMAQNTEGDDKNPVDPTKEFQPQSTFHAVVRIEGAPENTRLKATWYVVDVGSSAKPNTLIDSYEVTTDGTRNIDFTLEPSSAWPVGTYRVEVFVNDQQNQVVEFTVK